LRRFIAISKHNRIVEAPLMNDDAGDSDIISREIVEFRDEILLRIDTALVRLRQREQDESVLMENGSEPANSTRWVIESGSQTDPSSRRLVAGSGAAESQPVRRRDASRNNKEIARQDLPDASERPPVVTAEAEPDPKSRAAPCDSFKRLDALARLLDQRIEFSVGAASNSSEPSGEIGESNR
jgi:hypothetical protein